MRRPINVELRTLYREDRPFILFSFSDRLKMQYWRIAGLKFVSSLIIRCTLLHSCSYIQYSAVCARTLRRCLKTSFVKDAMKREESFIRVNKWQGGKISALVHPPSESMVLDVRS